MRTILNFKRHWHRSPLTVLLPVAWTALAAGAVLVSAVHATFLIFWLFRF